MRGITGKVIFLLLAMLLLAMPLTGCGRGEGLQDGYYTAQASDYNFGWKEYITIMVKGGQGEKDIDGITGATSSHASFKKLAAAVLEQARKGDSSIAYVNTGH